MHHFSTKQQNIFSNYQRVQRLTDGRTPLQGRYRHPKKRNKILIRFAKIVTSNVFYSYLDPFCTSYPSHSIRIFKVSNAKNPEDPPF